MKKLSPLKSIHKFCIECSGSSYSVTKCTANEEDIRKAKGLDPEAGYEPCPFWPWRTGHRPEGHRNKSKGNVDALNLYRKEKSKPKPGDSLGTFE